MVTQELIDLVALKFQQGESGKKIRESLLSQGYEESDVNSAISEIQKVAFMQIPAYRFVYERWHQWESKTANLSTGGVIVFFIAISLFLFGIAALLYMSTDPLGKQAIARDQERRDEVAKLQESLTRYHEAFGVFPVSLEQLVPKYLPAPLTDPRSEDMYEYILADNRQSYQVCMVFELQPKDCVTVMGNATGSRGLVPQSSAEEPSPVVYMLRGVVFVDKNKNGVKDNVQEAGQKGVAVRITIGGGTVVCEAITDNIGQFSCGIRTAGTYSVNLLLPPTYVASVTNQQAVTFGIGAKETSADILLGIYPVGQ